MAQVTCKNPPATIKYILGSEVVECVFNDNQPQTVPDAIIPFIDTDDFIIVSE